jgi:hypothetical protein
MIKSNQVNHHLLVRAKTVFENGYSNAAMSFAQFVQTKAYYNNYHTGLHVLEGNDVLGMDPIEKGNSALLITTEVFGEVFGKSYLLLNAEEFGWVASAVPLRSGSEIDLKEEFLKELDNIISASVVTKLSNEFNLKIYGDIPILIRPFGGDLRNVIYNDFHSTSDCVYVNCMHFSLDKYPEAKPLFIWVMDKKMFSTVPVKVL